MPFEHSPVKAAEPLRRIAVIGGGISGMGVAHMLADDARVVLFEAEPRLGGHARTRVVEGQPVDTGFIVFNYANYPLLTALFDRLDVPVVKSDMSFSASLRSGLEYGLRDMGAVFAQKSNALRPQFWGMLRDVMRFNARAVSVAQDQSLTLREFLKVLGTGDWFRDHYLLPLSGAIWSTPVEKILDFPAHALVRFFQNHALLSHTGQHQWYTVQGGSVEYVTRLEAEMRRQRVDLRPGVAVEAVKRTGTGVMVRAHGHWDAFDEVVFATHGDVSRRLLVDADAREAQALDRVTYQPNRVVLHSDTALMPRRRACWSAWNYCEAPDKRSETIDLTYWMNCLQPILEVRPLFVTLNSTRGIDPALVHDEVVLRHPVYDAGMLEAQRAVAAFNGARNTWFCGAWMRNGFHEDGLASAAEVARARTEQARERAAA
ncbi:NAD(P)/FAD-dependent oxidoreductase [Sagittula salina]|uniref:FAD-dependent oxidoreductase n=1 Tax=Sagittula salina TaxID=2820268 RepID=A0A940MS43_9RHOB|nr:FAD-dependent oxidoreductase [Sagittula salina]MBP0484389.1 FAD-dependent oxidoreductase [Sagittula salina]